VLKVRDNEGIKLNKHKKYVTVMPFVIDFFRILCEIVGTARNCAWILRVGQKEGMLKVKMRQSFFL
jgi:hypothetical protein